MAKNMSKNARRRRRRKIILGVEIVVLLLLIGALYVTNFVGDLWGRMGHVELESTEKNEFTEEKKEQLTGYTTLALFGVDNRQYGNYESGNSDTIIVVNINNDTKDIKLLSVYRDSYLNVYKDSYQKCNAAYAYGGPQEAINMLNRNLDLSIDNFVAVDFQALVDAVNLVGGIEADLSSLEVRAMESFLGEYEVNRWTSVDDTDIYEGHQTLNGIKALAYARIRKLDTDFNRAERQRHVITELFKKMKTMSLTELTQLCQTIFPEIATSLSITEVIDLAWSIKEYNLNDTAGFPFDFTTMLLESKGDIVVPCSLVSNVAKAHEYLFDEPDYLPTNTVTRISQEVISDTGKDESDAEDYEF